MRLPVHLFVCPSGRELFRLRGFFPFFFFILRFSPNLARHQQWDGTYFAVCIHSNFRKGSANLLSIDTMHPSNHHSNAVRYQFNSFPMSSASKKGGKKQIPSCRLSIFVAVQVLHMASYTRGSPMTFAKRDFVVCNGRQYCTTQPILPRSIHRHHVKC